MLRQHEIQIRVRYSETDAMGFLHHSHYASYFEQRLTELFREQGGDYREMEQQELFFVVAKLHCTFKLPACYDDVLTLKTTLSRIGPAKLEHDYELFREEALLAAAHSVLACVNREGTVQRILEILSRVI
jgi:acyl-CoA thioester hydrolase